MKVHLRDVRELHRLNYRQMLQRLEAEYSKIVEQLRVLKWIYQIQVIAAVIMEMIITKKTAKTIQMNGTQLWR